MSRAREALDAALESARTQMWDLQSGDTEAFLTGVEAHARTCLALSRVTLQPADEPRLRELLAVNASISRTLAELKEGVRSQIAQGHARARVPAAYLAS